MAEGGSEVKIVEEGGRLSTHVLCRCAEMEKAGPGRPGECDLLVEHTLEVVINGVTVLNLVCTPSDLPELILGRLYTEGIILGCDEVGGDPPQLQAGPGRDHSAAGRCRRCSGAGRALCRDAADQLPGQPSAVQPLLRTATAAGGGSHPVESGVDLLPGADPGAGHRAVLSDQGGPQLLFVGGWGRTLSVRGYRAAQCAG